MTEAGGSRPEWPDPAARTEPELRELAEREARFRVLFESASDTAFVTDDQGMITFVTPSVTATLGYAPEDLVGINGRDLFTETGLAELDASASGLGTPGSKVTVTTHMRTIDGTLRWVDITIQNLLENPAVHGLVSNVRDVTERMETLDALRAARVQQRVILSRSHDLTMFFESDGTIAWTSPNCVDLFGLRSDELIGLNGMQIIHPDDRDRVITQFMGLQNLDDSARTRFRITDGAGQVRWIEETATNLVDEPDVGYVVANLRDVTEEHDATHALAANEARHRSILHTAQEGIWVTEVGGRTVFANPRMAEILGVTPEVLASGSMLDFVDPEERPVVSANDGMSERGEIRRYETMFARPDRSTRWALVSSAPLTDDNGEHDKATADILHMVTDITDRKRDEAELRRVTLHDGLTGLPNRRLLTDRLARHLDHGPRRPTAVLFLDVDNLKDVNDSLGHGAGDIVLTEIARRLRATARSQDTVARSNGDEFLVLSEDVIDIDEAVAVAERLRLSLHAPIRVGESEIVVTASIGIAISPPSDAADLIRGAGIAMYRAKQNGRDSVAVFDHDNEADVQGRVRIQTELRHAISAGEFEVWYQPFVQLDDDVVRGVEALVRWRHPTRGLLLPAAFMSVAESTGLIRDIGRDVLETACRDAVAWSDPTHPVHVSVNIAGLQVVDDNLCAQVAEVLACSGIDPDWLTLELTESSAMIDQEAAERNLHGLRALGVRLALDDFGTGYSSLSFLRQLPVSVVKIDQSFVAGLGQRRDDELIVAGVISMSNAMGHTVIAEGVETIEQRDALLRLGCRFGQGFLWSRAVPLAELAFTIARIEQGQIDFALAGDPLL